MSDDFAVSILATLPDAGKLLAERDRIVGELKPLRAKFGGQGFLGERFFKQREAAISAGQRARLLAGGGKATEAAIEEATCQHPEYIQALTDQLNEKARWVELEELLATVEWKLRIRESDSRLLASEAYLSPRGVT